MPFWSYTLHDEDGLMLADLSDSLDVSYSRGLNEPASMSGRIPVDTVAAAEIEPGSTYVKAYRTNDAGVKTLRFYGPVWTDEIEESFLGWTAYDPLIYLSKRFTIETVTANGGGLALKSLVDTTNTSNNTGIQTSSAWNETGDSVTLDYTQNKTMILDVVRQLGDEVDPTDTEIKPIELSGGNIGQLWTYEKKGSSLDLAFGYGESTNGAARSVKRVRDLDRVGNAITAYNDVQSVTSSDATSIAAYRRLEMDQSYQELRRSSQLTRVASGLLRIRKNPTLVAEYAVSCEANAPRLFDDFDVGDYVNLHYGRGLEFVVSQRVVSVDLQITNQRVELISELGLRGQVTS